MTPEYFIVRPGKHGRRREELVGSTDLEAVVETAVDYHSFKGGRKRQLGNLDAMQSAQKAARETSAADDEVEEAFRIGKEIGGQLREENLTTRKEEWINYTSR